MGRIRQGQLKMLDRKTVSIPRACELVGVSRRTIYNWIASGKIQYIRTAGGSVRIFEDTLWREPEAARASNEPAVLPQLSRGA
jgi:excisionase family DNA binding protein